MTPDQYQKYGEWTYRGAWVLEISAATVGLSIAALLLYQSLQQGGWYAVINMIPFIGASLMVAFAELTKIPLATLLFSPGFWRKPFVFVALLGMAFITFESVFQGLEQSITIRQLDYQDVVDDLKQVQSDIAIIESGDTLDRLSSDKSRLESSIEALEARLTLIEEQRQNSKSSVLINQLPNELSANLENLQAANQRTATSLENVTNEFEAWKVERQGRYDDQKRSWEEQIKTYVTEGMKAEAKAIQRKLDNFAHPRSKPDWKAKAAEYSKLQVESRAIIQQTNSEIEDILQGARTNQVIISKLTAVDLDADEQRKQLQDQIRRAQNQLLKIQDDENRALTNSLADNERLSVLRKEEAELENKRRRKAQLDQIRRLAASGFFSDDEELKAEDVSDSAAKKVGVIWAGSLAALAALVGPMTAIVAIALLNIAEHERRKSHNPLGKPVHTRSAPHKLFQSIRSLIVYWRWRRVDTRIQEREVVVPKYHYVPVPADDPQEIWDFLDSMDVPVEVKEQVEARMMGLLRQPNVELSEIEVETSEQEISEAPEKTGFAAPEQIESPNSDLVTKSLIDKSSGHEVSNDAVKDSPLANNLDQASAIKDESASDSSSADILGSKPGEGDQASESKS
jgi:hypothetical protein